MSSNPSSPKSPGEIHNHSAVYHRNPILVWISLLFWHFILFHHFFVYFVLILLNWYNPFGIGYLTSWLFVLYILHMIFSDAQLTGGALHPTFRNGWLVSYAQEWFPMTLVKTAELDYKKQYIFILSPHALMPWISNFVGYGRQWNELFPGIFVRILNASITFFGPIAREGFLWAGAVDASRFNAHKLLESGTSVSVILGGSLEMMQSEPGKDTIVLKNRRGIFKLALEHGIDIVPVFGFGLTDLYEQVSLGKAFRIWLLQKTQVAFTIGVGRSGPLNLLPLRQPLSVVVGSPIAVEKVSEEPTEEQIQELAEKYKKQLVSLYNNWIKTTTDDPKRHLIIIIFENLPKSMEGSVKIKVQNGPSDEVWASVTGGVFRCYVPSIDLQLDVPLNKCILIGASAGDRQTIGPRSALNLFAIKIMEKGTGKYYTITLKNITDKAKWFMAIDDEIKKVNEAEKAKQLEQDEVRKQILEAKKAWSAKEDETRWSRAPPEAKKSLDAAFLEKAGNFAQSGDLDGFKASISSNSYGRYVLELSLDKSQQTALHLASFNGQLKIVDWILDSKYPYDINARDKNGWTPLHAAANNSNLEVCLRLLKAGAIASLVTENGSNSLHFLAKKDLYPGKNRSDVERYLQMKKAAQEKGKGDEGSKGLVEVEQKLMSRFKDFIDDLPSKVLRAMLEQGLDINCKNASGETALHLSAIPNMINNAALLISFGAYSYVTNKRGDTPITYAQKAGHSALVEFLLDVEQDFSSFLKLFPKEVFARIFSYCGPKDLGRLGRVCQLFRSISEENSLWYRHCVSQQSILPAEWKTSKSYKSIYIQHVGRLEVADVDWSHWNVALEDKVDLKAGVDYKYKLLVVGDPKIGKGAFIRRVCEGTFSEAPLESEHNHIKRGLANGRLVGISIWKLHKSWKNNPDRYFDKTQGILVCFDVTNKASFENLSNWLEEVDRSAFWAQPVIVGLRTDLKEKRLISFDTAKKFAERMGMKYFEVSAKESQNVIIPIAWLTYHIWDNERPDETSSPIASPVQPLRKGSSISPTGTPIIRKRSVTVKDGEKNCNVM